MLLLTNRCPRPGWPSLIFASYVLCRIIFHRYQFAGYTTTYQYSGVSMSDDGFFSGMSPCEVGTDCTDCGVKVRRYTFALVGCCFGGERGSRAFPVGFPYTSIYVHHIEIYIYCLRYVQQDFGGFTATVTRPASKVSKVLRKCHAAGGEQRCEVVRRRRVMDATEPAAAV